MVTSLYVTALLLVSGASYLASANYVAEVYFVVEPQVIRNYVNMGYSLTDAKTQVDGDIKFVLNEVNEIYKSLNNFGVNIEVRPKAIDFLNTEMFEDCKLVRKEYLQSDFALEVFREWLDTTDAKNKIDYDIALVWTGFDIFGSAGKYSVAGYATTKAACDKDNAVSIAEFKGTQDTAITTAHEIAHSLGAPHDGPPDNECSPYDGYVNTATSSATNKRRWEFSSCTAQAIVDYINTFDQNGNCLTRTSSVSNNFNFMEQSQRDIMDIHQTCKRALKDNDVYFCPYTNFYENQAPYGDRICSTIYCGKIHSTQCQTVMPPDGMMCGINKRCKKGQCVASSATTPSDVTDETCLFGDVRSKFLNQEMDMTCKKFLELHGTQQCQSAYFKPQCCGTCETMQTNIPGCPHGDGSPQCANYTADEICWSQGNRDLCCQTCHGYRRKRSAPNPKAKVEIKPEVIKPVDPPTIVDGNDDKPDEGAMA